MKHWREEGLSKADFTVAMMGWVIAELRYKAKVFQQTGIITVYNGDIVKSDTSVSDSTKKALKAAVCTLEGSLSRAKDFHPGTKNMVWNLVHPSLFPLVYGRSRILLDKTVIRVEEALSTIGQGEAIPAPLLPQVVENDVDYLNTDEGRLPWWRWPSRTVVKPYSNKFQWLPCEVELTEESGCRITSYINNLHPRKHKELYHVVEEVIACAIPLWNATLTPLDPRYRRKQPTRRIEYHEFTYRPPPENLRPVRQPGETLDHHDDRETEWESERRLVDAILPEPGIFTSPAESCQLDIRKDLGRRNLQVIVKLANIELTPEKPLYRGGSWHVEGQMVCSAEKNTCSSAWFTYFNWYVIRAVQEADQIKQNKHICATALYYYDCENIGESSRLAFRQESYWDRDVSSEQDHHEWLWAVFGCKQGGPQLQNIGDMLCREGRLLTFPNTIQHRVQPFALADRTKPGHRKILALCLVDPNIRVISTANIPPQRQDWWRKEIYGEDGESFSSLPVELREQIMDEVDFPIQMDEAKDLRLELMDERKNFVKEQTDAFMSLAWSLCEH